ncbi:MAG: T9SS type A sorting domain-containing protein [Bacteroidetes bacterium]|nr:T9SS type A sorting domain-containing protein [Bacteroidota bacterium]
MGLRYTEFVVPLIKAVQEQQKLIDTLFVMVNAKSGQRIENTSGSGNNTIETDITLTNKKIVLDQNSPNPFHDQTTITYEIKTDFKTAAIMFTDMGGEIIKEVPIREKGKGQINVFAQDLTTGMYTYYIVVDGKTMYAKKMVKE